VPVVMGGVCGVDMTRHAARGAGAGAGAWLGLRGGACGLGVGVPPAAQPSRPPRASEEDGKGGGAGSDQEPLRVLGLLPLSLSPCLPGPAVHVRCHSTASTPRARVGSAAAAVIVSRWVSQPLAFAGELRPPRRNNCAVLCRRLRSARCRPRRRWPASTRRGRGGCPTEPGCGRRWYGAAASACLPTCLAGPASHLTQDALCVPVCLWGFVSPRVTAHC
jgi:hypothetical protein